MKPDEKKAITTLTKQASELLDTSATLTVTDDEQLKGATELLGDVKKHLKEVESNRTAITAPMNKALKEVNDLFRTPKANLEKAEKTVKGAILHYHEVKQEEADREIQKIENRVGVGRGHIKVETAMGKLANVEQPETNIKADNGSAQIRYGAEKVRITDVHALVAAAPGWLEDPRVLEAIRMVVTPPILSGTITLPGTEVYRDKIVAGISR